MLKILLIAAAVIAGIIICILAMALTKPARFTIKRSVLIAAPPDKVFSLINDLHRWPEWSEDKKEAQVRYNYRGATAGQGAICEFAGSGSSGQGRMEIIESSPGLIRVQVDWAKPFVARNINIFTLEPQGAGTRVTWKLDGENVFALKVMTVFTSTDRLMGSHFDQGLAALKTAAEK